MESMIEAILDILQSNTTGPFGNRMRSELLDFTELAGRWEQMNADIDNLQYVVSWVGQHNLFVDSNGVTMM